MTVYRGYENNVPTLNTRYTQANQIQNPLSYRYNIYEYAYVKCLEKLFKMVPLVIIENHNILTSVLKSFEIYIMMSVFMLLFLCNVPTWIQLTFFYT